MYKSTYYGYVSLSGRNSITKFDLDTFVKLSPQSYNQNIDFIKNIPNKTTKVIDGTIYLGEYCKIPRYKTKEYINENKIKRTNCFDYADIVAINDNLINELLKNLSKTPHNILYRIYDIEVTPETKDLIQTLKDEDSRNYWNRSLFENMGVKDKFILKISEEDFKLLETHIKIKKTKFLDALHNLIGSNHYESYYLIEFYRAETIKNLLYLIEYLIKNPKIKIIKDSDFLKLINKEGLGLDWESFEGIDSMFMSGKKDNIYLAFDMLSNVDLDTNAHKIAFIFNKYQAMFEWGSGIAPGSNQGFKTLIDYFKSKDIKWKVGWAVFINNIIKLFPDKTEDIKKLILNQVNHQIQVNNIYSFEITDVSFK